VGVERAEGVTTNPLVVLKDQAEVGFEGEVRADEYASEGVRIFTVEGFPVLAIVPGFEADVVGCGLVLGAGGADEAVIHERWGGLGWSGGTLLRDLGRARFGGGQ